MVEIREDESEMVVVQEYEILSRVADVVGV